VASVTTTTVVAAVLRYNAVVSKPIGIDPTANVTALVKESIGRIDDLRLASDVLAQTKIDHLHEIIVLHQTHAAELRAAESERINAIRAVDVGNVAIANKEANDRAGVLASQLAATTNDWGKRLGALEISNSTSGGKGTGIASSLQSVGMIISMLIALAAVWISAQRNASPVPVSQSVVK
jgi:hypothetical protein